MKEEIAGKLVRQGVFDDMLWMGTVTENPPGWLGSVHQVPLGAVVAQFVDFSAEVFPTSGEAEEYVIAQWEKRFGNK